MAPRLQLHEILKEFTPNVYFQPPNNVQMTYPAIVYARDGSDVKHADNSPYHLTKRYQVTVIDRNPDSDIPDKVEQLPLCVFSRAFVTEQLNHYVFTLFF
jgi:hypothetical protein